MIAQLVTVCVLFVGYSACYPALRGNIPDDDYIEYSIQDGPENSRFFGKWPYQHPAGYFSTLFPHSESEYGYEPPEYGTMAAFNFESLAPLFSMFTGLLQSPMGQYLSSYIPSGILGYIFAEPAHKVPQPPPMETHKPASRYSLRQYYGSRSNGMEEEDLDDEETDESLRRTFGKLTDQEYLEMESTSRFLPSVATYASVFKTFLKLFQCFLLPFVANLGLISHRFVYKDSYDAELEALKLARLEILASLKSQENLHEEKSISMSEKLKSQAEIDRLKMKLEFLQEQKELQAKQSEAKEYKYQMSEAKFIEMREEMLRKLKQQMEIEVKQHMDEKLSGYYSSKIQNSQTLNSSPQNVAHQSQNINVQHNYIQHTDRSEQELQRDGYEYNYVQPIDDGNVHGYTELHAEYDPETNYHSTSSHTEPEKLKDMPLDEIPFCDET